jgi:hypothetical protein
MGEGLPFGSNDPKRRFHHQGRKTSHCEEARLRAVTIGVDAGVWRRAAGGNGGTGYFQIPVFSGRYVFLHGCDTKSGYAMLQAQGYKPRRFAIVQ